MKNRLELWNKNVIIPDLIYKFNLRNIHEVTYLENIVLKSTLNSSVAEPRDIVFALVALELLSNQKAKVLRTRKSIAAFKTRKFIPISSKVTIRNKNLYFYLDFFVSVVLPKFPQLREFGKTSVVKSCNSISLGVSNLTTFLQLNKESEQLPKDMGMTVTLNSNEFNSKSKFLVLLSQYQIPVAS